LGKVLNSTVQLLEYTAKISTVSYYKKKLGITSIESIDWESRKRAFDSILTHLY